MEKLENQLISKEDDIEKLRSNFAFLEKRFEAKRVKVKEKQEEIKSYEALVKKYEKELKILNQRIESTDNGNLVILKFPRP